MRFTFRILPVLLLLLCTLGTRPASAFFLIEDSDPASKSPRTVVAQFAEQVVYFVCPEASVENLSQTLAGLEKLCGQKGYPLDTLAYGQSMGAMFGVAELKFSALDLAEWLIDAEIAYRENVDSQENGVTPQTLSRLFLLHRHVAQYLGPHKHRRLSRVGGRTLSDAVLESFFPVFFDGRYQWAIHTPACRANWMPASLNRVITSANRDGLERWLRAQKARQPHWKSSHVRSWHGAHQNYNFDGATVSAYSREIAFLPLDFPFSNQDPLSTDRPLSALKALAFLLNAPAGDPQSIPQLCWRAPSATPWQETTSRHSPGISVANRAAADGLTPEVWLERIAESAELESQIDGALFDGDLLPELDFSAQPFQQALFANRTPLARAQHAYNERKKAWENKRQSLWAQYQQARTAHQVAKQEKEQAWNYWEASVKNMTYQFENTSLNEAGSFTRRLSIAGAKGAQTDYETREILLRAAAEKEEKAKAAFDAHSASKI